MKNIKFALVRNVKAPVRGTIEAAGIDLFVPYYDDAFMSDLIRKNPNADLLYAIEDEDLVVTVLPGGRVNIPSGVKVSFEAGSALIAANKSGISTKKGLIFTCQVIDSDYDGEIHIGVANISNEPVKFKTGDKLIQVIHSPVYLSELVESTEEDIHNDHICSERMSKGFGEGTGNN